MTHRPALLLVRAKAGGSDGRALAKRHNLHLHVWSTARLHPLPVAAHPRPDAVVITSAAAAALIPPGWRDVPAFAVSPVTACALHRHGVQTIHVGPGTAEGLLDYVLSHPQRPPSALHLGGVEVATPLAAQLSTAGLPTRHVAAYDLHPRSRLSRMVCDVLQSGHLRAVLFTSRQAVQHFEAQLAAAHLTPAVRSLTAIAISPRVQEALTLPYGQVCSSDTPRVAELVRTAIHMAAH